MHVDGLRGTLAQTDQSDGTLNKQMADGQNQRLARKLSGKTLSYVTASDDQYFDGVIDSARDVHAETHWGHIPFCRDKATALLRKAIEANNVSLIVATDKGTPMGFLYGSLGEYLVGLDNKLLTIQAIAIRRHWAWSATRPSESSESSTGRVPRISG